MLTNVAQQKPISYNWLLCCRDQPYRKPSFSYLLKDFPKKGGGESYKKLIYHTKDASETQVYTTSLGNRVQILQTFRLMRKLNARSVKLEISEILKHKMLTSISRVCKYETKAYYLKSSKWLKVIFLIQFLVKNWGEMKWARSESISGRTILVNFN